MASWTRPHGAAQRAQRQHQYSAIAATAVLFLCVPTDRVSASPNQLCSLPPLASVAPTQNVSGLETHPARERSSHPFDRASGW